MGRQEPRKAVPVQISRLLHAHGRRLMWATTGDLIVSDVIRSNELQVWFVAEHVVDVPLVHAG